METDFLFRALARKKRKKPFSDSRGITFSIPKGFHLLHERIRRPKTFLHSKSVTEFFFELVHDRQSHGGFHKIYDKIVASMYMRKFNRHL